MDIVKAWKDEGYRNSLSEAERAALPENPAGIVELSDEDMHIAVGGTYGYEGGTVPYSNQGLCKDN
jgi:mersacidin/lichenicidin family type 2 lantibiotic